MAIQLQRKKQKSTNQPSLLQRRRQELESLGQETFKPIEDTTNKAVQKIEETQSLFDDMINVLNEDVVQPIGDVLSQPNISPKLEQGKEQLGELSTAPAGLLNLGVGAAETLFTPFSKAFQLATTGLTQIQKGIEEVVGVEKTREGLRAGELIDQAFGLAAESPQAGAELLDKGFKELGVPKEVLDLGLDEKTARATSEAVGGASSLLTQLILAKGVEVGLGKTVPKTTKFEPVKQSPKSEIAKQKPRNEKGQFTAKKPQKVEEAGKVAAEQKQPIEVKQKTQEIVEKVLKKTEQPVGELPSNTKGFNKETINKDLGKVIEENFQDIKTQFEQQKGGRLTDKQLLETATKRAGELSDADILNVKRGETKNATETTAMRIYATNDLLNKVKEINEKVKPETSPMKVNELLNKNKDSFKMLTNTEALVSESGRALRAKQIVPTKELIKEMETLRNNFKNQGATETVKFLDEIIRDAKKDVPGFKDKLSFIYYNFILSNPITDVRNITGNVGHLSWELLTRSLSQSPVKTARMFKGAIEGIKKSPKEIKEIINGDRTVASKFLDERQAQRYSLHPKTGLTKALNSLLPTSRLAIEDAFFRNIAKEMELAIEKPRLAKQFGESIKQVESSIQNVLKSPELLDPKSLKIKEVLREADRYADFLTFQSELGSVGKAFQGLSNSNFLIKLIIPFVRTPANIIKAGFANSPAGFVKLLGESGKRLSKAERAHVTRRAVAGSVFLTGLAKLMGEGIVEITGQGPTTKKDREIWERTGRKPNHIYFNGKGLSYLNMNPFNVPFALMGNLSDKIKYDKNFNPGEKNLSRQISSALAGMAITISDESFLRGVGDIMKWLQFKDEKFLEDFFTRPAIPNVVSVVKDVNQIFTGDKPRFEAESLGERIARRIGVTEGLKPTRDIFGKPKQSSFESLPFNVSQIDESDPLIQLLQKKKLTVPTVNVKTQKVGDKLMTEAFNKDQIDEFLKLTGEGIEKQLRAKLDLLNNVRGQQAQQLINNIAQQQRNIAKAKILNKGK